MSEAALLEAVRDRILVVCGYDDAQVQIELDDNDAPPTAKDLHILICPSGWRTGAHNDAGGVLDEVFDIAVTVLRRCTAIPRDNLGNVLIDNLGGINVHVRKIIAALHFSYEVNNQASTLVGNTYGFTEPLKFRGTTPTRTVGPEAFQAVAGKQPVGVKRTIIFGGARRIQVLGVAVT